MVYFDNLHTFALRNFDVQGSFNIHLINRFNDLLIEPLFTYETINNVCYITIENALSEGYYEIYINNILTEILYV